MTLPPKYRREWARANKDKINLYNRTYRARHPEKVKKIQRQWRQSHPHHWRSRDEAKVKEAQRRYRQTHREKINEKNRQKHRRYAAEVSPVYVRQWLKKEGIPNPPTQLVQTIQAYIKLKRLITYGDAKKHRRTQSTTTRSLRQSPKQ